MITITWSIESTHRSPLGGDQIEYGSGEVQVDGFMSHSFDHGLDVSTHPIEQSQDVSDHARPRLKTHEFQCFVSDDPYNPKLIEEDHAEKVIGAIDYLIDNAIPVDLETDRAFLEDYLIINRSGIRQETTGDGAEFSLSLQELQIANVEMTDAPAPSVERARRNSNRGSQQPNAASDATANLTPENIAQRITQLQTVAREQGPVRAIQTIFRSPAGT